MKKDKNVDLIAKYGDVQASAMSHINPDIKREIEDSAKRFGFNTSIEKYVGGTDNIPVLKIYFGTDDEVTKNNYLFSYTILPNKYDYYSLKTDYVKPPGLVRKMLNLVPKIQEKELSYFSNLKK